MSSRALLPALALLALAGCGTSGDDQQARDAAQRFYRAVASGDGRSACQELSVSAQRTLAPCARAGARLKLNGGRVVVWRVYITNALVKLPRRHKVLLGGEP